MKLIFSLMILTLSGSSFSFDAASHFQKNCVACHSIGEGDKTGPDLAGLSKRRKLDWILKFVKYPEGMISGDPDEKGYEVADPIAKALGEAYKPAMMSDQNLTKEQVVALLKYIDSLKKEPKGKITTLKVK